MEDILSKKLNEFDEWNNQFYERLPLNDKEVEKLKQFLISFYKQILEEDIKTMEGLEVMGIGGDFGEGYEAGYKKAVSSLIDSKREALSNLLSIIQKEQ